MRRNDWLCAQYQNIVVYVQPRAYKVTSYYRMVKMAISLIKSKLWVKKNMKDEVHLFVYDLDDPYPEDLIRYREKYGLDYDD